MEKNHPLFARGFGNLMPLSALCLSVFLFSTATVAQTTGLRRNGKIAFTSNRDGNREIYVMNADGTNQVRITNNTIVDDHPTWSPDGNKIAFVSELLTGGRGLFTMNSDGSGRTAITPVTYIDQYNSWPYLIWTDFYSMDWSPDGTKIVFQDNYDITVVNADGSDRHAITDGASYDFEPAWSPDGLTIVFSRDPLDDGGLQYGRLSTISADGTNIQFLPNGWDGQEYAPRWSPSGNKILFVIEFTDEIPFSVIYITNADGSNDELFEGRNDVYENEYRNKPTWSPDEKTILFDKWVYGAGYPGDLEIYAKNIGGLGSIQLTNTNGWNFDPSWQPLASKGAPFDFDGDGRTDISVFRPSDGKWYLIRSTEGINIVNWGIAGDNIAPGDFDRDGRADTAVFRPSNGNWYVVNSSDFTFSIVQWGIPVDIPVPGDYDGDGKADRAIFRQWQGDYNDWHFEWHVLKSSGGIWESQFGIENCIPLPADYDGDGLTDRAVFASGTWQVSKSDGGIRNYNWGQAGDIPVPGDYDGDGKADIAVWRPSDGKWYIRKSGSNLAFDIREWGVAGDIPVPGDYDGDGTTDLAVYRNGAWYLLQTTAGMSVRNWGVASDDPVPAGYLGSQ